MPTKPSVAIFGGGVAGLTAAHELILRGFAVDVYEKRPLPTDIGGKARTQYWDLPGVGTMPGEHGFRFFPRFYSSIRDTMSRIPLDPTQRAESPIAPVRAASVAENLVPVPEDGIARRGARIIPFPRRRPATVEDLTSLVRLGFSDLGLSLADQLHIGIKLIEFFSSGDRRRLGRFEKQTFWDFIEAHKLSPTGQDAILRMPKVFVAMDSRQGNARTLGNAVFLLLRDMLRSQDEADSILAGPTSDTWLLPWRRFLDDCGVLFHDGQEIVAFDVERSVPRVRAAITRAGGRIEADHFVLAVPLETAAALAAGSTDLRADPNIARLAQIELTRALDWMVGVQLYLKNDVRPVRGHLGWADSPWALTAISQAGFWPSFSRDYGRNAIGGILSVDVSDWKSQDGARIKQPASACTRAELEKDLLHQLSTLLPNGQPLLAPGEVLHWHWDDDLRFSDPGPNARVVDNTSPLLIHPPDLWRLRPKPAGTIENLFLAGDYVRNDMDLATMEGANQSARDAVNAILVRTASAEPPCASANHLEDNEWPLLRKMKDFDDWRYGKSMRPLSLELPPVAAPTSEAELDARLRARELKITIEAEAWSRRNP